MPELADPSWDDQVAQLSQHYSPDVRANAQLLADTRPQWETKVVPRTSMSVLLFTRIGQPWPFAQWLYCTASAAICEFGLRRAHDLPIEVGRCLLNDAGYYLDRFLAGLVGDEYAALTSTCDEKIWNAQITWLRQRPAETRVKAMLDVLDHAQTRWEHTVVPLPQPESLVFVAAGEEPSATRSTVNVSVSGDQWTVSHMPTLGGRSEALRVSCRAKEVTAALDECLAKLLT